MSWEYIAGIFDPRGFIRIDNRNKIYAVFFNFTEPEKEVFENLIRELKKNGIEAKAYATRKKGKYQEYILYVGGLNNVIKFLRSIKPYSARYREIDDILEILESKKAKKTNKKNHINHTIRRRKKKR